MRGRLAENTNDYNGDWLGCGRSERTTGPDEIAERLRRDRGARGCTAPCARFAARRPKFAGRGASTQPELPIRRSVKLLTYIGAQPRQASAVRQRGANHA